ncbi:hypothetical protein FB45DRAFT_1103503 [Roridomyces roridus]|uniref:Uncharacterized protein n=1 Tax=Roridomyces roridus TaxID=1738132 RepID=A0AAD7FDV1_9AGAR|nr:hypothetical protein FB45DRAFT_1103503 [Roridomyces roridus]
MPSAASESPNGLSPAERSRLVRSTRKLQALLGETPQVIESAVFGAMHPTWEADSSFTPYHSSTSRVRTITRAIPSSLVLADSTTDPRPRLELHKCTLSLPSPPPTPLSPTSSIAFNTLTASLSRSLSAKDMRRHHAAKLARTLGENVAPALAAEDPASFPDAVPIDPGAGAVRRRPSATGRVGLRRPSCRRPALPSCMSSPAVPAGAAAALVRQDDGGSHAVPIHVPLNFTPPFLPMRSAVLPLPVSESPSPTASHVVEEKGGADHDEKEPRPKKSGSRRRKERDWSGEWNVEMRDVAKQLRALKG